MSQRESDESCEILGQLDCNLRSKDLADQASYSVPQFNRIAKMRLGEAPMTVRRRLLLERAAFRLTRTTQPITGFLRLLAAVEKDNSYDMTFVDAVCDPPEVFSYVGVLTHALTYAAYRRMVISQELRTLDVGIDGVRDPIEYPGSES